MELIGKPTKDLSIRFKRLKFPNQGTLRVEYIDNIGPIYCEIKNASNDLFKGSIQGQIVQQGNSHSQMLIKEDIEVPSNSSVDITIDEFQIDKRFRYQEGILVKIEIPEQAIKTSKMLWLGIDPRVIFIPILFHLICKRQYFQGKRGIGLRLGSQLKI